MPLTTLVYDRYHIPVHCQTSFLYHSVVSHTIHESYLVLCIQSSLNIQILPSINYQENIFFFLILCAGGKELRNPGFLNFKLIQSLQYCTPDFVMAYCPENNCSERCKMTCSPLFFLLIAFC